MILTQHFTLAELTKSETAIRKGIVNTPDEQAITNLTIGVQHNTGARPGTLRYSVLTKQWLPMLGTEPCHWVVGQLSTCRG